MRKFALTILSVGLYLCLFAQTEPGTRPDKTYGKNGTLTITRSLDKSFNTVTSFEFKDNDKKVRRIIIFTKGIDGKYTRKEESFSAGGTKQCSKTIQFDENYKIVSVSVPLSDTRDKVTLRSEIEPSWLQIGDNIFGREVEFVDKDLNFEVSKKTSCSQTPGSNCQPRATIFVAYSYLQTMTGGYNESLPLGAHASFIYNVSSHIGLGLDASIHTKRINDVTLTRTFLLAEAKYTLGKTQNCARTLIPNLHLLAGLGCEKFGMSKGSGFAFGGGVGLDLRVCKNIMVGTQADFIAVKFKGGSDLNSNIRASAGLSIRF